MFFFNEPATTKTYTLSLHDALPILGTEFERKGGDLVVEATRRLRSAVGDVVLTVAGPDRWPRSEEQRLNSSHVEISYAVFCLKKKSHIKRPSVTNQAGRLGVAVAER